MEIVDVIAFNLLFLLHVFGYLQISVYTAGADGKRTSVPRDRTLHCYTNDRRGQYHFTAFHHLSFLPLH